MARFKNGAAIAAEAGGHATPNLGTVEIQETQCRLQMSTSVATATWVFAVYAGRRAFTRVDQNSAVDCGGVNMLKRKSFA